MSPKLLEALREYSTLKDFQRWLRPHVGVAASRGPTGSSYLEAGVKVRRDVDSQKFQRLVNRIGIVIIQLSPPAASECSIDLNKALVLIAAGLCQG